MVTVTVPATSANVGAGFDSLGLAVSMHNVFTFEESDRIQISSVDGTHVPAGSNNLVYRSARVVYDQLGIPLKGLRITQRNDIPMARGLGSSSACIVAGIMGANALLGDKLTERQMLTLATAIEGHPDNVAPAMLGGFVTSVIDEGQVYSVKKDIDPELAFAAFVPDFRLLTSKARAALPAMVSHKDAVYNLSRAALATAAFCEGNYALLGVANWTRSSGAARTAASRKPANSVLTAHGANLFCSYLKFELTKNTSCDIMNCEALTAMIISPGL